MTNTAANTHLDELYNTMIIPLQQASVDIQAVQSEVTAAVTAVIKDTVAAVVATYQPMTAKDVSRIKRLPAVCDQPCIDIAHTLRELAPDASELSYLCYVYAWGYLQGSRGVVDWHGQRVKQPGGGALSVKG